MNNNKIPKVKKKIDNSVNPETEEQSDVKRDSIQPSQDKCT